jgi:cytochrome c biogenesis protein ResB
MKKLSALLVSDAASLLFLVVLLTIIALGTVLVQGAPFAAYAAVYGAPVAAVIASLGLDDVYHSWYLWWPALLLAVSLFCRAKRASLSLPGLITTLGTGLVLFGALYGSITGIDGLLPISVGEVKDVLYTREGMRRLPFSVSLDAFAVEQNAAFAENYRSTLQLRAGEQVLARGVTSVNHPLRSNGYAFYQQAFDPQRPFWTGLKVVKDPGSKFVFLGLLFFNAGMTACIVRYIKAG